MEDLFPASCLNSLPLLLIMTPLFCIIFIHTLCAPFGYTLRDCISARHTNYIYTCQGLHTCYMHTHTHTHTHIRRRPHGLNVLYMPLFTISFLNIIAGLYIYPNLYGAQFWMVMYTTIACLANYLSGLANDKINTRHVQDGVVPI